MTTLSVPSAILALRPDWSSPVRIGYAWRTAVVRLDAGTEQRSELRTWPTRRISMALSTLGNTAAETRSRSRFLDRFIRANQHCVVGVPSWPGRALLSAQAAAGTAVLACDAASGRGFYAGDWCLLLAPNSDPADSTKYEAAAIAAVHADRIDLSAALSATWPAGTEVYPLICGRLPAAIGTSFSTRTAAGITLELVESPLNASKALPTLRELVEGPTSLGSYNTSGTAYELVVRGDLMFIADYGHLVILDISDPTSPVLLSSTAVTNVNDCKVDGDYAYLGGSGTGTNQGALQIWDISDPTAPVFVGRYTNSSDATDHLVKRGNLVYLAMDTRGWSVIDVSDPTNPSLSHHEAANAKSIAVSENGSRIYVCGTAGVKVYDSSYNLLGTYYDGVQIPNIAIEGNRLLHVAEFNTRYFILDVSNPAAMTVVGELAMATPWAVKLFGRYAAVFNGDIKLVDVSDPSAPSLIETIVTSGTTANGFAGEGRLYAANQTYGAQIFSWSRWETYRSAPLFAVEPNWISEPSTEHRRSVEVFAGMGSETSECRETEPRRALKALWTGLDRDGVWDLVEFFNDRRGRARGFWFPSWSSDLTVTTAILAGDTHLHVSADADYETSWLPETTVGRHLFIAWPDETHVCRKVASVTGGTQLNLDAAVGKACAATDLGRLRVSFLLFARFDSDEIEVGYDTETVGDVELAMTTLSGEDE
jgi:hypothetical protein